MNSTKLTCSIITKDLETVRFFQSFENKDFVFNFYSFDLNTALISILKNPPTILIVDFDHPFFLEYGLGCLMDTVSCLAVSPVLVGLSKAKTYAYEALKAGFSDYLLSPIRELEIRITLLKIKKSLKKENSGGDTICLKSYSDYRFLKINEILFLKADNNTTDIFLKEDKEVTAFKSLKYFEKELPENFFRIHNSYIVNASAVQRINYNKSLIFFDKGPVICSVPFSRTFRENVDNLKKILGDTDLSLSS